ncbi:MAG: hydroxymethylglutaryl-CoA lyase, partial [Nitrospinae bacterium]|nr:hydroxymethylglutaryl-CoA lyase [Nitrospinota bacterium]
MSNPELPTSVLVRDVVMRDGIQNLKQVLPTELKIEIIEGLADAGIRRIEATSFMNPKAVPATADADEVMRRIRRKPGVTYECLVANERGARRAVDAGSDGVQQVISITDVHNRANVNRSVKQSLEEMAKIS